MILLNSLIEDHYYRTDLFEDILKRLKEKGINIKNISRSYIASVDEFHIRGAEVSKELAKESVLNDLRVLDIGCGLGGSARMLADEYNCRVNGIDLSHEYIRTAQKLSELVGLNDKTEFTQGDALDLPYDNDSFDVVWTQHVQMNIRDKRKFYSEIKRVLTDEGTLMYYDIFRKNRADVNYPVPWANYPSVSFLDTITNMDNILKEQGFTKIHTTDQTEKAIRFLNTLFENIKQNGHPELGLNVLMGSSTDEKLGNILNGLVENRIVLQSGIYKKVKKIRKNTIENYFA